MKINQECKATYIKEKNDIKGGNKKKLISNLQERSKKCKKERKFGRFFYAISDNDELSQSFKTYMTEMKTNENKDISILANNSLKFLKTIKNDNIFRSNENAKLNKRCYVFMKFYLLGELKDSDNYSKERDYFLEFSQQRPVKMKQNMNFDISEISKELRDI